MGTSEYWGDGDDRSVVALTQALVGQESPSNREGGVARIVADRMRELGYDDVHVDAMGNVVGLVKGTGQGGAILFDGHMDTIGVTPRSAWQHDPFGGQIEGSRLYGRGTSDMKGAIAAMVEGVGRLARAVRTGRPAADIWVVASVAEEMVEGVALTHVLDEIPVRTGRPRPSNIVIGEATGLAVATGQRGRAELVVETLGVPAHSSTPHLGVNAVYSMTEAVQALRRLAPPEHPWLGAGVMELTDIISTPYPATSVVPDRCAVTYDRRTLAGETAPSVLRPVEEELSRLTAAAADSHFKASVRLAEASFHTYTGYPVRATKFLDAWLTPHDSALVRAAQAGLAWAGLADTAAKVPLSAYKFCTNGSAVGGRPGYSIIGFGPGNEAQAHTIDEFTEIDQLTAAARGYLGLALAVAWPEKIGGLRRDA